ncbi:hypothetical protein ACMC9I_02120 [Deinococcota bacterium DY0809b]
MEVIAILLSIIFYLFLVWVAYEIVRRAVIAALRTVLQEDGRLWVDRLAAAIAKRTTPESKSG